MTNQWFVQRNGKKFGPIPTAKLKQLAVTGKLKATDLVRREGKNQFILASEIKGLFPEATAGAAPPLRPPTRSLEDAPMLISDDLKESASSPTRNSGKRVGVLVAVASAMAVLVVSAIVISGDWKRPAADTEDRLEGAGSGSQPTEQPKGDEGKLTRADGQGTNSPDATDRRQEASSGSQPTEQPKGDERKITRADGQGTNAPGATAQQEHTRFAEHLGTWEAIGYERKGEKTSASLIWNVKTNGSIVLTFPKNRSTGTWKYTVNPAKEPKEIDLYPSAGPLAGKRMKGIYVIENNTLIVCYPRGDATDVEKVERPSSFDVSKRNDLQILRLKRLAKYSPGSETKPDPTDVTSLIKAAEQGKADAQNSLGNCYYHGTGVRKSRGEAVNWYRKAAQQGLPLAQYNLAYCYEHGEGVGKDLAQALSWYRKAAAQGHADAQTALAELDPAPVTDADNPFRKAKVGDWATYRQFSRGTAGLVEFEMKLTVIGKTAQAATVLPTGTFIGKVRGISLNGEPITVDLTRPFDQIRPTTLLSEMDPTIKSTIEIVDRGKEKIKVGGKEYDCTWIKLKTTVGSGPFAVVSHEQIWTSKDVPLLGVVRAETKNPLSDVAMELKETGGR